MSEEVKHTPGPWELRPREAGNRVYAVEIIAPQFIFGKRTHARDICIIRDWCDWNDYPANAALIAAAPSLLDAAKHLRSCGNLDGPSACEGCTEADEAIARAEDSRAWLSVGRDRNAARREEY